MRCSAKESKKQVARKDLRKEVQNHSNASFHAPPLEGVTKTGQISMHVFENGQL